MNERRAELGPRGHELRQPDRASTTRTTTRPRATWRAGARAAARPRFAAHRRHAAGRARVRRAPARGRQPQPAGRAATRSSTGVKTGHTLGPATCWSARRGPRRRPGDQRGAGRAERGGARRRHARAAALGPRPVPSACACSTRPAAGPRGRRAPRRATPSWCPPRDARADVRTGERVRRSVRRARRARGPAAGGRAGGVGDGARGRSARCAAWPLVTAAEVPERRTAAGAHLGTSASP